jgi:hypothetical protein
MANKQRLFTRVPCRKALNQQHKQDISALPLPASRWTYYSTMPSRYLVKVYKL